MSLKASPVLLFVSLALLCGLLFALFVQYYLGIEPCHLCFIQRYLFIGGIATCLLGAIIVERVEWIKYLALLAVLANTGFSFFHVGVEQKWWQGPQACMSLDLSLNVDKMSEEEAIEQLKAKLEKRKFVPCDKVSWRIFGIPATAWNTLFLSLLSLLTFIMCLSCQRKAYNQLFRK